MKDISEHSATIGTSHGPAWEAFQNGDKAKAYKHYAEIYQAAREAMAICAGPEKLPAGWNIRPVTLFGLHPPPPPIDKASCVAAAYERRAMAEGRVDNPEYAENKV